MRTLRFHIEELCNTWLQLSEDDDDNIASDQVLPYDIFHVIAAPSEHSRLVGANVLVPGNAPIETSLGLFVQMEDVIAVLGDR